MMSILKEECSKVGFEMHTQKTQVLSNGIQEAIDNRREILGMFKQKVTDAEKKKLERQQKRRDRFGTIKGRTKLALKNEKASKGKDIKTRKERATTT